MSDDDPTHRVTHKRVIRPDGVYEEDDEFAPLESELESFGDRLEPLDPDADPDATAEGDEPDSEGEGEGEGEDAETEGDADSGEDEGEPAFTPDAVESAGRDQLRTWASDYDDVNGNWGTDRLRAELAEKAADDGGE